MFRLGSLCVLVCFTFSLMAAEAPAPSTVVKDAISGTVNITFNTRTTLDQSGDLKANSAAVGVKDVYQVNLTANKLINFSGEINRQPNLYSKFFAKQKQAAQLYYNVTIGITNPRDITQKRTVGKWVGVVPIDTASGAYQLAGGASQESPLRFDVDSVGSIQAFKDLFAGALVGKAEKKVSLASYTMKRLLPDGKTVQIQIKRNDPMRFEGAVLAKGPSGNYPRTTVSGNLNYDYETGNYFADNMKFSYVIEGKETTDVMSGSIKWVKDAQYDANGKSQYEFNLRWNEEKYTKKTGEADAFTKMSDEDAFFTVDTNVPTLTGTISFTDTFAGSQVKDMPASSKVEYHLDANKLEKHQIVNFLKMWLVAIGPTNDE